MGEKVGKKDETLGKKNIVIGRLKLHWFRIFTIFGHFCSFLFLKQNLISLN